MNLSGVIVFAINTNQYGTSLQTNAGFVNVDDASAFEPLATSEGRMIRPLEVTLEGVTLGTKIRDKTAYLNVRCESIVIDGYAERAVASVKVNPAFKPDTAAAKATASKPGQKAPAI